MNLKDIFSARIFPACRRSGFLLPAVLVIMLFLMIVVPVMVKWVQEDTKISTKDQASSSAFNLAETAVDRGYWKVKSSTATYGLIAAGGAIPGYRFDATYRDVTGGSYRIYICSGPVADQLTIIGEGRNANNAETRSIKAVYTNTSVLGAIITGSNMSATGASVVHWGPVLAMGDITVSGGGLTNGFPRKLSKQVVKPFDPTNDLNPSNTDGVEWWSDYDVPELPQFDFATMKASAAATGTLNCDDVAVDSYTVVYTPCAGTACVDPGADCTLTKYAVGSACTDPGPNCSCDSNVCAGYACVDSGGSCSCSGTSYGILCTGAGCTDSDGAGANCVCSKRCTGSGCSDSGSPCDFTYIATGNGCSDSDGGGGSCVCANSLSTTTISGMNCCSSAYYGGPVTCSYGGSGCTNCSVNNIYDNTTLRNKDLTWYWDNNVNWAGRNGLRGTVVVRGNLGVSGGDNYSPGGPVAVPAAAWKEYRKIDTSSTNQYPGDTGLQSNAATYTFGSCGMTCEGGPLGADLGVYGFLYVGGDFNRTGDSDVYGAMWVEGNVSGAGNTMVFYDAKLKLPTLNVVLMKESWEEQAPNAAAWP